MQRADIPRYSYGSIVFLSPDIVLLPNAYTNALDLWDIRSASQIPTAALSLPALNAKEFVTSISSACEPRSAVPMGLHHSTQTFHLSPKEAIVAFQFKIYNRHTRNETLMWMFAHRRSLLSLCPEVSGAVDIGTGDAPSTSLNTITVPWDTWGPDVTRWLDGNSRVRPVTIGARVATVKLYNRQPIVTVLDFHPPHVNLARAQSSGMGEQVSCSWVQMQQTSIQCQAFSTALVSRLPYVATVSLAPSSNDQIYVDTEYFVRFKARDTITSRSDK